MLGRLAVRGRQVDQSDSFALLTGASNLLAKAERALADGDQERARALVARAAALPWDGHEQADPGPRMAGQRLFGLVMDAIEASDEEDRRWLELAEDLLAQADGWPRAELASVLGILVDDWTAPGGDVESAAGGLEPGATVSAFVEDQVPPSERTDYILGVVALTGSYRRALVAAAILPPE